jgi:hypothetical protein
MDLARIQQGERDDPEVIAHDHVFRFRDAYLSPHSFIASRNLEGTRVPDKSAVVLAPDVRKIRFKV